MIINKSYPTHESLLKTISMGILTQITHKTMLDHLFLSFKLHFSESAFAFGNGFLWILTWNDVPTLVTVFGIFLGSVAMPFYYGRRRYKKQEERESEEAIIKAIKELRNLGFILTTMSPDEQRNIAIEWLSKPIKKII